MSVIPNSYIFGNRSRDQSFELSAANGSIISTYGSKLLNVDLGLRRKFSHIFILASVSRPIIGADFLIKHGLLVDLKHQKLIDPKTNLSTKVMKAVVNTPSPKQFSVEKKYGDILKTYPLLTKQTDYKGPVKHNVVHHIFTNGRLPYSKPRRLDPSKHKTAQAEFEHMVNLGICRPSSSPYSSPLHMIPNKDNNDCTSMWKLPLFKFRNSRPIPHPSYSKF